MIYQITVPKIHCSGCVNLIKMSLEEVFGKVDVNEATKIAEFESENEINDVKMDLDKVFEELKENGYEYTELKQKK